MKRSWTVLDHEGTKRTDIAVVVAETKSEALRLLRDEMQEGNDYDTFVIIDESIFSFAPGNGYKGEEFDCDDRNPDMWDVDDADGVWETVELPCYCGIETYEVSEFLKYHEVIEPMCYDDFKKKFPDITVMDKNVTNVYLENGVYLLNSEWNGECYSTEDEYYYPVNVPISYCDDEDDEDYGEPTQYETVGYIV